MEHNPMVAPQNEYAFDYDVMIQAAENWQQQKEKREQSIRLLKEKRYDDVEPKERLAKRANRLLGKVKEVLPIRSEALSKELSELLYHEEFAPEEIDNELVERILGETRDFLSIEFLEKAMYVNRCVGRIVTHLGNGRKAFGTGFLVSPQLLLTNHHVLQSADRAADSVVELDYQVDRFGQPLPLQQFDLNPDAFFLNDKGFDFALVAVKPTSHQEKPLTDYGWCPLIQEEGKIQLGESINIIQHPRGEMKQVVIRENKLLDLLEKVAHYGADTEPGSSGSPVFNDQWEVVALHHSGVPRMDSKGRFLDVKGNVWRKGDDPSQLAWVANEGIRISRLTDFITSASISPHEEELRAELLNSRDPLRVRREPSPIIDNKTKPEVSYPRGTGMDEHSVNFSAHLSSGSVTITIPLQITVSLGVPDCSLPQKAVREIEREDDTLEAIEPDRNYNNRPGYDPNFLGFPVPLPKLSNAIRSKAFEVSGTARGNKYELKYYHFSVIMNRERRLAFVAAVNFDASAPFKHNRKQDNDRWFFDPRVDKKAQAGEEIYSNNPFDRGHLVRRADAAWGKTPEEAKLANDDTFHFTNCSPQHEIFNQATKANDRGLLLWGNIEDHIAQQARDNNKKLCIFNGPVFYAGDRKYRGLRLPKEFWKVIVFENDDENPVVLAFLLSQEGLIRDLPEEEFEVGPYEPFQVPVREIEAKTKLDFGNLRNYDPLENEVSESHFEAGTDFVSLARLNDIIF
jgi:endonuclease G